VFPDVIRRAMAVAAGGLRDYRIEQHGDTWQLRLDAEDVAAAERELGAELARLWRSAGVRPATLTVQPWTPQPLHEKRRRIRCVSR
jgi:hypothetical protein